MQVEMPRTYSDLHQSLLSAVEILRKAEDTKYGRRRIKFHRIQDIAYEFAHCITGLDGNLPKERIFIGISLEELASKNKVKINTLLEDLCLLSEITGVKYKLYVNLAAKPA